MTLEGEYYMLAPILMQTVQGRNPHDIGRRILRLLPPAEVFKMSRNPHDIGRRILQYP